MEVFSNRDKVNATPVPVSSDSFLQPAFDIHQNSSWSASHRPATPHKSVLRRRSEEAEWNSEFTPVPESLFSGHCSIDSDGPQRQEANMGTPTHRPAKRADRKARSNKKAFSARKASKITSVIAQRQSAHRRANTGSVNTQVRCMLKLPKKPLPDRTYYVNKHGKTVVKALPGQMRKEAGLHIHMMTENECRAIFDKYDDKPLQTFQSSLSGRMVKVKQGDGSFVEELSKAVRLSNELLDKLAKCRKENGGTVPRKRKRSAEDQAAWEERNRKANERYASRKKKAWSKSHPGGGVAGNEPFVSDKNDGEQNFEDLFKVSSEMLRVKF